MGLITILLAVASCGRVSYDPTDGALDGSPVDAVVDTSSDAAAEDGARDASGDAPGDAPDGGPAPGPVVTAAAPAFMTDSADWVAVPGGAITIEPAPPAESWILLVSARLGSDTDGGSDDMRGAELRYLVGGAERGRGDVQNATPEGLAPWLHYDVLRDISAPVEVHVEMRELDAGTATVEDLHLVAFAVPAGADLHHTEQLAPTAVTSPDFAPLLDLAVEPASAGDYLVMMAVVASELPDMSGVDFGLLDPFSTSRWPSRLTNLRRPNLPSVAARIQALDATPQTYSIVAQARGTSEATLSFMRITALRTDAFEAVFSTEDPARRVTNAPSPITVSSLDMAAPAGERDHVYLSSVIIDTDCAIPLGTRPLDLEIAGETLAYAHTHDSCGYRPTFGAFRHLRLADAASFSTHLSSVDGTDVEANDSVIHVLRLPPRP